MRKIREAIKIYLWNLISDTDDKFNLGIKFSKLESLRYYILSKILN